MDGKEYSRKIQELWGTALHTKNDSVGQWKSIEYNDRGWRFYCSKCGGHVYWPQATQGENKKKRVCPYPNCPWCKAPMCKDNRKNVEELGKGSA